MVFGGSPFFDPAYGGFVGVLRNYPLLMMTHWKSKPPKAEIA